MEKPMTKILIPVLLIAALLLPLASCGGSQHTPEEKYFLIGTNVKLPYWQQVGAGLAKAASEMHVKAELLGPDGHDPKAQHEEFAKAMAQKPSGIMVSASDPSLKDDIDAAIGQGIPVITIDSDAPDSKRLTFIGTDNYKTGVMAGKVAGRALKFRGAVTVFTMPEQNNLKERLHGYEDAFATYPQIKITEIVDAKGDPRVVSDKLTQMIDQNVRFEAILCLVSFACPEVADVLSRRNVTGKIVMGMDTDDRTLIGIQKGVITATVAQRPFTMAFRGLKMLDDLHHNPLPSLTKVWSQDSFSPVPNFVDTGATLIDANNVDPFIVARNAATRK
jgi:ribose transport system substrate-binding protein